MKFQYKKELYVGIDRLDELGAVGWELVNIYKIHPQNEYNVFIFKRQL